MARLHVLASLPYNWTFKESWVLLEVQQGASVKVQIGYSKAQKQELPVK
ncbi:UNVERIFIED_ORG: hypothetical protein ABIC97_001679 [Peribacillus simplex]